MHTRSRFPRGRRAMPIMLLALLAASSLPLLASPPTPRFGVNLAGGEGGSMPGTGTYPYGRYGYDYIYPNADEFAYFKSRGFNLVRLPVKWERVQNTLNGPLTPQDIGLIDTVIANAEAQGIQILIDLHNYNSYRILTASGWESHAVSSTGAVTYAHLQDFWGRIASRYVDNTGVFGYDLMNEPGGTLANWQAAAQAAVDTIRSIDTNHWIVVEGVSWAGAQSWTGNNATLHIDDPADKLMYSAHSYWDRGYQNYVDNWKFDGLYTSYAQENGSPTMGVECLAPFVDWIVSHGYNGFVGEYGVPGTGSADSDLWNVALDNALAYLQTNGISGTYWTGGPWYGNYQLTCEPSPITGDDRPQMSVLSRYTDSALSPGFNPQADTILKADNIHALNQGSSWVGGIVPDANDIALWDATVGANTVLLGSDQSWGGLAVDAAHSGNVTISDGATLTLGTAGITYVPNIALSLSCPIVLAADQTWTLTTGFFNVNEIETQGHQLTVTGNSNKKFKRQIPGGGPILVQSGSLTFDANADSGASESPITVKAGAGVVYDKHTGSKILADSITLESGKLDIKGDSAAPTLDTITGDLTVSGVDAAGGYSASTVTLTPNSTRNVRLIANRLVRTNHGISVIRGTNLGLNIIASQTANSGNIAFVHAPTGLLGGGGGSGDKDIAILPGVLGGTTSTDGGSTFATYTPENGIRPLDAATEYTTSLADGTTTTDNIRLYGTGVLGVTTNTTTINSLIVAPSSTVATSLDGAGVIKISSGHVLLNPANQNMTTTINAPLDFGAVQGVIGGSYNRLVELKSAISGSAGLLFYQVASAAPNTQLSVRYSSGVTYTGDTIVLGRLEVNSNFLPSGMRTGDVYVHGYLKLNQAGYTGTINGLFGGGTVFYGNSGTSSLSIGDNNATSTFTGNISGNSNLSVNKVGAGTLTLDGATTHTKGTTVQGGTLVLNGSALSPFTVYSGATLRGKGMIDKSGTAITIQSGGTLAPGDADGIGTMTVLQGSIAPSAGSNLEITIGKGGCSFLDVAGDITGNATVSVTVKGEGPGKWLVAQASSITADFSSATPDVKLTLEADGTQLWAERLNPVSLLIMK